MDKKKNIHKTIHIPQNLQEISHDINFILDKNETAIREYISRYIYTSNISSETNIELDKIFKQVRDDLVD